MPIPDFECPNCGKGVHSGDIPDHIDNAGTNNGIFEYECECGAIFNVYVEYEPRFDVQEDTMRLPAPTEQNGETDADQSNTEAAAKPD